jgi:hypothetical protein
MRPDPDLPRLAAPTKGWAVRRAIQLLLGDALPHVSGNAARLPAGPDDITLDWLSRALCGGSPGARVISVAVCAASTGTTTRTALSLDYNHAGVAAELPTRVFVKWTTSLAQRLMLGLGGLIHGEPGFYQHVRPMLQIEAPTGYFAAVDSRAWRSVVIMEDVVSTRGARFWLPGDALGRDGIEELLANVAAWHGALWDSPLLRAWRWLRTQAEQASLIDALLGLANRLPAGAERAESVIPESLRARQPDLYEGMRRSMRLAGRGPLTYLHGDLHIANTYRSDEGRMGIADWQAGLKGSWAHDYGYLVATALAVEDRRAWERDLLAFYVDRLAAAGGPALTVDAGWLAYRQSLFYPYFAWLYTIGRSRLQPSFQPDDVSLTMIGRIATAIEDLDGLGAVGLRPMSSGRRDGPNVVSPGRPTAARGVSNSLRRSIHGRSQDWNPRGMAGGP